jgi:branched-chain amino acid transport system permease protein
VRRHALAVGFFGAAALTPLVIHDGFFLDSLVLILMWGAVSGAWNVAGGYAGQVSLGHSAFFGIGAYSAALMATRLHASPGWACSRERWSRRPPGSSSAICPIG